MKNIYKLLILILIIYSYSKIFDLNSIVSAKELPLPKSKYSLLTNQSDTKPIEINMSLNFDGNNSTLDIGVVCNKTLGEQTLYANLIRYDFSTDIRPDNWLEKFIQAVWNPYLALMSFPTKDGLVIDCKAGAIYHFVYPFQMPAGIYNTICSFAYIQNADTKEIFDAIRSENILYCEFKAINPANQLTLTAGKESVFKYIITNPTNEKITYEISAVPSNLLSTVVWNKEVLQLPPKGFDTLLLHITSSPREEYGTLKLSVKPLYLKDLYSIPETRNITYNVNTDDIQFVAVTNGNLPDDYSSGKSTSWFSNLKIACYAQPTLGNKWVFMNYNLWKSTYHDLNYKVLFICGLSHDSTFFGSKNTLENAALECIAKGKNLIVNSNCGLSLNAGKFPGSIATKETDDFYKQLGIIYHGFINLCVPIDVTTDPILYKNDTLSVRVVEAHDLNQDIDETNTTINSGFTYVKRTDYIGISGENKETFPFLWYNRENSPKNSYAGVATTIGLSKIIYMAPGMETIGNVGNTLLIRNFLRWMSEPSAVVKSDDISELNIFPNPANQFIEIGYSCETPFIMNDKQTNGWQIFNSLGENVSSLVISQGNRIFIGNLSAGSYFLLIRLGDKTICKPFIIKR